MPGKRPRLIMENEPDDEDFHPDRDILVQGVSVYFYAEVTRRSVLHLVKCLGEASDYALRHCPTGIHNCAVYLFIHSGGGCAYAGLSAFDHIRNNKVPVTTIADGFLASAATFLLLGGEHRVAMRHATVLVHQLSVSGFSGKYSELEDEMVNSTALMETVKRVYMDNTDVTKKKLEGLLRTEKNLEADKCLRLGFVHELW